MRVVCYGRTISVFLNGGVNRINTAEWTDTEESFRHGHRSRSMAARSRPLSLTATSVSRASATRR